MELETSITKGLEGKELTTDVTKKPITTPVTTTAQPSQASKYYKGRSIHSQPRSSRDGNLNSYNR